MADSIQGIYEDVATLQEQVALLQSQMSNAESNISTIQENVDSLQPKALTANTDLNNLGVGTYYIPDVATTTTILNKPVSTTSNALIIVLHGASNGELQQWYFINTKNTSANNKIYHRYFYDGEWSDWETGYLKEDDTGWIDLPLASGVSEHNQTNFPCRYRKIGNRVVVEGCVNGFSTIEKTVATLPSGFRPSKPFYLQGATNGGKTDTFNVQSNGVIARVTTTLPETSLSTANYHFINMTFLVD